MLPVGPLMIEHRLIERMINLMNREMDRIDKKSTVNIFFIGDAVDFLTSYADRCHHDKEEQILFFRLKQKELSKKHKNILNNLIDEHKFVRTITQKLRQSKEIYNTEKDTSAKDIYKYLNILIDFYPKHIKKEDKDFFIPIMDYLSNQEKDKMMEYFWEFDKNFVHEKYKDVVERYEGSID
jgi:hemerythrin-like domain-containing protein